MYNCPEAIPELLVFGKKKKKKGAREKSALPDSAKFKSVSNSDLYTVFLNSYLLWIKPFFQFRKNKSLVRSILASEAPSRNHIIRFGTVLQGKYDITMESVTLTNQAFRLHWTILPKSYCN